MIWCRLFELPKNSQWWLQLLLKIFYLFFLNVFEDNFVKISKGCARKAKFQMKTEEKNFAYPF